MNFDILIIIIILLLPLVSMFYFAYKYNIYRYYGFKSLLKIININKIEKKKIIKFYFIFWTLIFIIVLYLCFAYMILTNNWSLIQKTYNFHNDILHSYKFVKGLENIQQYVYDTDNNLIKEIDPRNKEKSYTYDKLHRLTKTTSEMNNTAIFTYDKVDNVIGIKDPKGTNTVLTIMAQAKQSKRDQQIIL